jgi:hypothetical protein
VVPIWLLLATTNQRILTVVVVVFFSMRVIVPVSITAPFRDIT